MYQEIEEKKKREEEARKGSTVFAAPKSGWKEAMDKVLRVVGHCLGLNCARDCS